VYKSQAEYYLVNVYIANWKKSPFWSVNRRSKWALASFKGGYTERWGQLVSSIPKHDYIGLPGIGKLLHNYMERSTMLFMGKVTFFYGDFLYFLM
jgi:hypothetical protein